MPITQTLAPKATDAGVDGASDNAAGCFHCGLPIPIGTDHSVVIEGRRQSMCCPGCAAVARAIIDAGLTDFYRHRTEPSQRGSSPIPEQLRELQLYDHPELQRSFVRTESEAIREASLILEGIVCAACVWLSEHHVGALPGVLAFRVNYSTHRAQVRWDNERIHLSEIMAALAEIGYRAHPFDPGRQETLQKRERALALRRVAIAGMGAMQVMMLAVAMYYGDHYGMDDDLRRFMRWISLLITVPVLLYAARPFFRGAWRDLRRGRPGMDVPVALAIGGAFSASAWYTWRGGGEVYYDSVTMFTFFLLTARFLEMGARHQAGRVSEELARMLPATATRLNGADEAVVAVVELKPGDRVLIRPGETVPADGQVREGVSSVDESLLTGESRAQAKQRGAALIGGSLNVESPLVMEVDKVGTDTVLSSIVRLLERAQGEKPAIGLLADRVAGWFVTGVLLVAATVAGGWWLHDPSLALPITLSVLVVTCPCALSLATPTAVIAATGALTRMGVLTTRGHALEALARTTHIVFDKTGTLTYGRPRLVDVISVRAAPYPHLELAAALERGSEHPIGRALAAAAQGTLRVEALRNLPGHGVEGRIDGISYRLGTATFAAKGASSEQAKPETLRIALGDEHGLLAWLELADELRPDAAETVKSLRALGLEVRLMSGDRPAAVVELADRLGIEAVEGGVLPADKLRRINSLQRRGAVVAMVGDGINDAPVLAGAQVSLAMGGGTQLAHAAADMVLLSDRLDNIPQGITVARRTLAIIRQNLGWAIAYNITALPLAAAGWIAPWMAALGMSLSSLLVVTNALRLKWAGESASEASRTS
jgi:Cu2+-exporting ATPase